MEKLISRIATGDREALAALYHETSASVFGFALSILKDPHGAEDVMQDTYIRIYTSAGSYQAQGKPLAWILTIVKNLARMKLREGQKEMVVSNETFDMIRAQDSTESAINRLLLESALAELSDEESQILILHSVAGLLHREIAALLELPLSTVLSKYRRTLAKLQKRLKERGWEE